MKSPTGRDGVHRLIIYYLEKETNMKLPEVQPKKIPYCTRLSPSVVAFLRSLKRTAAPTIECLIESTNEFKKFQKSQKKVAK